jgi:hypothetical protein
MNKEEHTQRHIELHKALDELFADSITHAELGIHSTILQLMEWSCKQLKGVDHGEGSEEGV